jgi:hypothetical protein
MNPPWLRKSLLGLMFLMGIGSQSVALGNGLFTTSYYAPLTSTAYLVPSSYVVPTTYVATSASYLYPSSYVYPTVATVYPSSYIYPTAYTTYYSPRSFLFPRRYVARPVYSTALSYYPTSVYYPTVYPTTYYTPTTYVSPTVYSPTVYSPTVLDYPVVASSASACNEVSTAAPMQSAPQGSPNAGTNERAPSSVVESTPTGEPAYRPGDSGSTLPPASPAPAERDAIVSPPPPETPPAPSTETNPPTPPPATEPPPPAAAEAAPTQLRRQSQKPVGATPTTIRPLNRSVLEGKVVSGKTQQGEQGVRVIVTSRAGSFVDRIATTNSQGQYAVQLPDGDWTVKVAMPSGRVYAVSQITISSGQIVDSQGQEVPSLIITR